MLVATTHQWVALVWIRVPWRAVIKRMEAAGYSYHPLPTPGWRVEHKAVTACSYESTLRMSWSSDSRQSTMLLATTHQWVAPVLIRVPWRAVIKRMEVSGTS